MARFIGYVQGQSGQASRLGSPRSGITAEARGWNVGIVANGRADGDEDVFDVYLSGGSNAAISRRHLGTVTVEDGSPVFRLTRQFKVEMDGADPVVTVAG